MKSFSLAFLLLSALFLSGCKKNKTYTANNTATLNVINGIIQKDVKLMVNGSISNSGANGTDNKQNSLFFGTGAFFYAEAQNTSVSVLNRTDSSVLATQDYDLMKDGIYTLLLAGVAPNIETALIDDSNIPIVNLSKTTAVTDSVINIRFINLAPNVQNIDIRITGSTTNEVTGLAYKGASDFKAYPARSTNGSYNFQYVENGTVLTTSTLNILATNRFKNRAYVLTGMKNPGPGQPGLSVKFVNYYQ